MLKRGLDYIRQKLSIEPRIDWEKLEKSTPEEQKAFLDEWADKFKIKPFSATVPKIKIADHLMVHRYGYTHHLICIEVQENGILAMEYGPRDGFEMEAIVDLESLGEVHQKQLTFEQLEDMKVNRIKWPKKLRRFTAKESIRRANTREGERKYNCLTNNCEHFVVWCICGLEVSLQLKSWHTWAKMVSNFLFATSRDCFIQTVSHLLVLLVIFLLFPKVLDNTSDENSSTKLVRLVNYYKTEVSLVVFAIAIIQLFLCYHKGKPVLHLGLALGSAGFFAGLRSLNNTSDENSGNPKLVKLVNYYRTEVFLFGVAIAGVIQLFLCYHKWKKASDMAKRVEIIAKAVLHLGLGSLGFFAGLHGLTRKYFLLGIICTIALGYVGIFTGNLLGAIAKWCVLQMISHSLTDHQHGA